MKHEVTQIKEGIEQCKATGDMMPMPHFDSDGVSVKEIRLRPTEIVRYRRKYDVNFANGDWIRIEYCSKNSDPKAVTSRHRSEVKVTCSDPSQNFTDSWDEKA